MAKSAAPIPITLASSLSATAITADVNGNNQSAATELFVTATADTSGTFSGLVETSLL